MTDKTQPEALRLALSIDLMDTFTDYQQEELGKAAAELRRQHTRIAELEAELEAVGAGGVQALSAAPAVLHEPTNEMYRAAQKIALPYDDDGGTIILNTSQIRAIWHAMLAASPTPPAEQPQPRYSHLHDADAVHGKRLSVYSKPPAEQQAITPETGNSVSAQGAAITFESGAVYAELPDFDSGNEPIWEAVFNWKAAKPGADASKKAAALERAIIDNLRNFADRTHALRMEQAAPKAAPVKACVCGEPQASGTVHRVDGPCYVAAPQQEAQERVYLVNTGEVRNGLEMYERHDKFVPLADCEVLYAAPQTAPAPLSDAVEHYLESQDALDNREYAGINAESYETLIRRRNASRKDLDAALAAQGGRDAG